jgi:tetratricopeptide (TPR) repeat protein
MKIYMLNAISLRRLIAVSSLLFLVSCGGAEERANNYLEKANEYYAEENYQKAKVEIKNVLQITPKNSDARVLLAKINQKEGEYRQSFQNFHAAAEEDPAQIEARVELAKIYIAGGKHSEAKAYIDQILAIEPQNTQAKGLLAGLLMTQGNRDAAIALAKETLGEDPGNFQAIAVLASIYIDTDAEYVMGLIDKGMLVDKESTSLLLLKSEVLKKQDKTDDVAVIYKNLIDKNPEVFKYYDSLTSLYLQKKDIENAKAVLLLAIKNNPDSIDPVGALINLVKSFEGSDQAIILAKKYIEEKPEVYEFKKLLVGIYLQDNKINEAKSFLEGSLDKNNNSLNINPKVDLAKIYFAEKNTQEVNRLLQEIFVIESTNTDALILRAKMKMAENSFKDAIADLRSALKNEPNLHEAFQLLAVAQEQDGSSELALDSYFSALEINPNDDASLINAARLSQKKGDAATALKLIQRLVELQPYNVIANEMLLSIYLEKKDWDSSKNISEKFINADDSFFQANGYSMLGKVMARQEKWQEAEVAYINARKISPKSYAPLVGELNALLAQNKIDQAMLLVEKYTKEYPDSAEAQRLLANLYHKHGKSEDAISQYQSLIKQHPEEIAHYQGLAGIYLSQKNWKAAESIYLESIEKVKTPLSSHILVAGLYVTQKRFVDAEKHYQKAYQLSPQNMLVRNNLAVLLVNHFASEENIQKSLELVNEFAQSSEPVYLDTLGWVQYKAGNFPQSISYLQKAISLNDNPEFRYHLGVVYEKSGQKDQAKRELDLAVKQASGNEDWLAEAKTVLTKL